jgi:hypothetical protein
LRLKSNIIIKTYNDKSCYLIDLESEEENFYKCENVTSILINYINDKNNFDEADLIKMLKSEFRDVKSDQIENDVTEFINYMKNQNFVAE